MDMTWVQNVDPFFISLLALALTMLAHNIVGMGSALVEHTFDWQKALYGAVKTLFIFLSLVLLFVVGLLLPEATFPLFGGETMTIQAAISLILTGALGAYLWKALKAVMTAFGITVPTSETLRAKANAATKQIAKPKTAPVVQEKKEEVQPKE